MKINESVKISETGVSLSDLSKLVNKNIYNYELTVRGGTIPVGSWQALANDLTTDVLPAGVYLIIFTVWIFSNVESTSICTSNAYLDNGRLDAYSRQTSPVGLGLTSTIQCAVLTKFSESKNHILNIYSYAVVPITVQGVNVKIIKID